MGKLAFGGPRCALSGGPAGLADELELVPAGPLGLRWARSGARRGGRLGRLGSEIGHMWPFCCRPRLLLALSVDGAAHLHPLRLLVFQN